VTLEANGFGPPHRVVEAADWHDAVAGLKRDGYTYFDWYSAVDEHPEGFRLVLHVARLQPTLDHLLLVSYLDRAAATIPSIADVFAGADWHERETHEMFGIGFTGHPGLHHLYLPGAFEGFPLRKDFPLLARAVKPWPGLVDKEPIPGEDEEEEAAAPA
jgi:NADH-quinone oxidoreductase subunit C